MKNPILSAFSKAHSLTNNRYVNTFVYDKPMLEAGRQSAGTPEEHLLLEKINSLVVKIEQMETQYPVISELNEVLFLIIKDLNNFKVTIEIINGKANVQVGWDLSKSHTFIIPVNQVNLQNLDSIVSDAKFDLVEVYRIVRVLFIPFLQGLYQANYDNFPRDKSYLKLDNFLHVEVKNEFGAEVSGFPGNPKATVVNVDGQWLVFEGLQGDPDVKFEMNLEQALRFAYIIRIRFIKNQSNLLELTKDANLYNQLKEEVTVYERDAH